MQLSSLPHLALLFASAVVCIPQGGNTERGTLCKGELGFFKRDKNTKETRIGCMDPDGLYDVENKDCGFFELDMLGRNLVISTKNGARYCHLQTVGRFKSYFACDVESIYDNSFMQLGNGALFSTVDFQNSNGRAHEMFALWDMVNGNRQGFMSHTGGNGVIRCVPRV
ncbi:MAG: hypothetical protein M1829_006815 [Trizodia sp. TS-e1964]|nr:MAG: hypothetical protein M1829_006815 [Trizodia sp. TS-e1964]